MTFDVFRLYCSQSHVVEMLMLLCIVDSQKTQEQKVREAQLLQQLVDLVDEQDRLERKKMATQGR